MKQKSGSYLVVSSSSSGKVRKCFRYPLTERTANKLAGLHSIYLNHILRVLNVPNTVLRMERVGKDKIRIVIEQDDLSKEGMLASDFFQSNASKEEKIKAYLRILDETLKLFEYAIRLKFSKNILLGIDSGPKNWWLQKERAVYFDTIPPIIAESHLDVSVILPSEDPNFFRSSLGFIAQLPIFHGLLEHHLFNWPSIIRTLLIETAVLCPELEGLFLQATKDRLSEYDSITREIFEQELSSFSLFTREKGLQLFLVLEELASVTTSISFLTSQLISKIGVEWTSSITPKINFGVAEI